MASAAAEKAPENRLDRTQVDRAAVALLKHLGQTKAKNDLFGDVVFVYLQIHLKKLPGRSSNKPVQIRIPHPLLRPEDGVECCIIAHEPTTDIKAKLVAHPVPSFTKVIGVGKLRKNYKEFKARRELADRYDLFVADDRVVRMMPQLLGKTFYERKKVPVPVRLERSTWAQELATARDSTYALVGWGQTMSVRVGRSNMTPAQVAENIMAAAGHAVARVAKKWRGVQVRGRESEGAARNLQSVHLVARDSLALPIYKAPLVGVTGGVLSDDEEDDGAAEEGSDEEDAAEMRRFRAVIDGDAGSAEDSADDGAARKGKGKGKAPAAAAAAPKFVLPPVPGSAAAASSATLKGAAGKAKAASKAVAAPGAGKPNPAAAAAGEKAARPASAPQAPSKAAMAVNATAAQEAGLKRRRPRPAAGGDEDDGDAVTSAAEARPRSAVPASATAAAAAPVARSGAGPKAAREQQPQRKAGGGGSGGLSRPASAKPGPSGKPVSAGAAGPGKSAEKHAVAPTAVKGTKKPRLSH